MPNVNTPTICQPPITTPMHTGASIARPDPGTGDQGLPTWPWILYFNCLSKKSGMVSLFLARGILLGIQTVAADVLGHRYDTKTPQGFRIDLLGLRITAKVKPTGQDYIADILVSTDQAVTWTSLFPSGLANKPKLPVNTEYVNLTPVFTVPSLFDTNQLRVDVLQADGVVSGVELLLVGGYVPLG